MKLVMIAAGLGLFISLVGTPLLIRFLRNHNYAQAIRVSTPDEHYPSTRPSSAPRRWGAWRSDRKSVV